jgi:hypothetical protein
MPISGPLVPGSIVRGEMVPFPSIDRFRGEPSRVRLGREGRLLRPEHNCPRKYFNFSADGTENVLAPWLAIKPSTLFSPDCDLGVGVFAKQQIRKGDIVSEYGGVVRSRKEVEELREMKLDTHIKPILPWKAYLDSRWTDGYPANAEEPPPISWYLHGHYLAGLMNSAYFKVIDYIEMIETSVSCSYFDFLQYDCNCEYLYRDCQAREDMPGLTHTTRLFVRATEDVGEDEELLVHYGHDYFTKFSLPKVAQPRQP